MYQHLVGSGCEAEGNASHWVPVQDVRQHFRNGECREC